MDLRAARDDAANRFRFHLHHTTFPWSIAQHLIFSLMKAMLLHAPSFWGLIWSNGFDQTKSFHETLILELQLSKLFRKLFSSKGPRPSGVILTHVS